MSEKTYNACLLVIGNEILSGRTQDRNLQFLGERLNSLGIRLMEARVIPDVADVIVDTINQVRGAFDYVFTTGGIGPTHDDITSECVARAFGVRHCEHPEARAILEALYEPGQLNEARLRMAKTPEGATLIENPVSKAPGFQIENVYVLAGIPSIMQAMVGSLQHGLAGGLPMQSRSLTVEAPEGRLAKGLGELQERYPDVEMGSYPFSRDGRFAVRLVLRSTREDHLATAASELEGVVAELGASARWDPV